MQLQPGTLLRGGAYRIEKMLGEGGFGITYLAVQTMLERKVAIKEFFMKEFCNRDEQSSRVSVGSAGSTELVARYREKFMKEARNIARMNHPNIVKVIDVFEDNDTAYYVMEYLEKGSLADKIRTMGYLPEPLATKYIQQIADALKYIHSLKVNHLDVKPANVMLADEERIVLIDFGLAKQYDQGGRQTSSTPAGISEGYAPMEQYKQGGVSEFTPETDIYALGATFFKILTGKTPPSASDIFEDGVPTDLLKARGVSSAAIGAICKAMKPSKKNRLHSIEEFEKVLSGQALVESPDDEENKTVLVTKKVSQNNVQPKQKQSGKAPQRKYNFKKYLWKYRKQVALLGVVFLALVIVGIVGLVLLNRKPAKTDAPEAESSVKVDASYADNTLTVNGVTYKMVSIEGGSFMMGTAVNKSEYANMTDYEKEIMDMESPQHQVTISNFLIGETEVTQGLWEAVMGNNPSGHKGKNRPVENVSWDDCQLFIHKLDSITGLKFRLPTEAEWEYAARGGNKSKGYKFSGSNDIEAVGCYMQNSYNKTLDVKRKAANELGLYDMTGNVFEWCQDTPGKYTNEAQTDPQGPSTGENRNMRGGGCYSNAWYCRPEYRSYATPDSKDDGTGLRLALTN